MVKLGLLVKFKCNVFEWGGAIISIKYFNLGKIIPI